MGLFDVFKKEQRKEIKKDISLVVSDKLPDEIYKTIEKFEMVCFENGEIEFFNKSNIDDAQKGFRYNPITNEIINDWIDDEYIIIGYDCSSGCGPDPIIIYNDKNNYPVYWLMTDGGDWDYPLKIADTFEEFVNAYKNIIKNKENDDYVCKILTLTIPVHKGMVFHSPLTNEDICRPGYSALSGAQINEINEKYGR